MHAIQLHTEEDQLALRIEVDIGSCRDLADYEEAIQQALNEAGTVATAEALKRFDTDGQPLERDGRRFTTKGEVAKPYETPYGTAFVARHVYQHSGGGATYCPLEERAGLVLSATPKFARMIASKYAEFGSARVQQDLAENHGRHLSRGYISKLAEAVAAIAESMSDQTIYRLPEFDTPTETLVVAMDEVDVTAFRPAAATVAIASIGFYDGKGQCQYGVYVSDILHSERDSRAADLGRFNARMKKELKRAMQRLGRTADAPDDASPPAAQGSRPLAEDVAPSSEPDGPSAGSGMIVGISGGQPWSTEFLQTWATVQFIDPAKVADRLSEAATVYFERCWTPEQEPEKPEDRAAERRWQKRKWVESARDRILSREGIAAVISELEGWVRDLHDDPGRETISRVVEFLARERDAGRMNYEDPRASHVFANAGILADSARILFGDRIDHPKFKIGLGAARAILILRELTRTEGRWKEFWDGLRRKDRDRD